MLQKIPIIHLEGVFCELALFLEISTSPDWVGTKIEPKKNCHLDAFAFQGISNVTDIRGANNPENLTRAHPAKVNNRSGDRQAGWKDYFLYFCMSIKMLSIFIVKISFEQY